MLRATMAAAARLAAGLLTAGLLAAGLLAGGTCPAAEPLEIGGRLELLVDRALVDSSDGLRHRVHRPTADRVVLTCDRPWEGNTSAYFTVLFNGEKYQMYYRGSHWDTKTKQATHAEVACYAESVDGVQWTKPTLGLFEFDGSKQNNIVWDGIGTHNFTPFFDGRPGVPAEARYKAIARGRPRGEKGLYAFFSPDGIHWKLAADEPVITDGAFDSQNLAFWDSRIGKYREYHRSFIGGVRAIVTGVSDDFLEWTDPQPLDYGDAPNEHLYTNAILPHPRAPHLLLGFPTRYHPKRGSQVEPTLMASRDGRSFLRHTTALIPVTAPQDRMGNRSNYLAWGLVDVPDSPWDAVYATEAYYEGPDSRLRRFLFRKNRYVSFSAGEQAGELLTKPLRFAGNSLQLTHETADAGGLRVEIQDADGAAIPGFSLDDCENIRGDAATRVGWSGGKSLESLSGKTVRLRFVMRHCDLFALQFIAQ